MVTRTTFNHPQKALSSLTMQLCVPDKASRYPHRRCMSYRCWQFEHDTWTARPSWKLKNSMDVLPLRIKEIASLLREVWPLTSPFKTTVLERRITKVLKFWVVIGVGAKKLTFSMKTRKFPCCASLISSMCLIIDPSLSKMLIRR